MAGFLYLRDPLFLICSAGYALNQIWLKPHWHAPFLHNHLNDLLLIPCALPPVLFLHRLLGIRPSSAFPRFFEMLLHLAVWSVVVEIFGPRWVKTSTGDPLDILAYSAGAIGAMLWWQGSARRGERELSRRTVRVGKA